VPFITEALWERLNELAPQRGLDRPLEVSALLVAAPWPQAVEAWRDDMLERDVTFAQEVAREVRDVRNKHNVAPGTRLEVQITASRAVAERLEPHSGLISNLAGLARIEVSESAERPPTAATRVVGEAEVHVLGVLDPLKERARLTKHQAEVSGQIRSSEARLSNPGFVAKAPAEVVEAARSRLAELKAELARVEGALAALDT
jgi:valyl-tRNA synthetase